MDHSKYCNPNKKMGFAKKSPELKYTEGIDIEGVHYTYAPLLFDSGIFQDEDCTGLSDFELSDTTDDAEENNGNFARTLNGNISTDEESSDEIDGVVLKGKRDEHNVNSASTSLIAIISTDESSDEIDNRVVIKQKRDYACHNTSVPSSCIPITCIKKEKEECYGNRRKANCCEKKKDEYCEKTKAEYCEKRRKVEYYEKKKSGECCEKRKTIKRAKSDDECISISSSQSLSYPTHKKSKQSSSTTVIEYKDVSFKDEPPPPQLFGYFFCELCNLEMSSEKVYHDHMTGKRHRKNLKMKYVDHAAYQAIPPSALTEGQSKYPKPPHGVIRRNSRQRAKIQDVIRNEVKKPCPGLNLVTEIQGIKETQYYCSICNAICSPNSILSHLTGFKHQLNSVKYFRPGNYERMSVERKNLIQDRIVSILWAIQKKEGLGRMTVEVEELASDSNELEPYDPSQPSTSKEVREPSLKNSGMSFIEYYDRATIPDKSASDFYCEFCDSHMNSEDMWQAHITGKRHITNLKKLPGERPSKCRTIPLINARAKLLDRFEDECPDEPIVGLNEIREIQIRETNSVSYNCFLCCSCHTSMDIVEHLISLKHRQKYLDHVNYPYMQFISGMSELSSTPIVRSICSEVEAERGRGDPGVHINKSAFSA